MRSSVYVVAEADDAGRTEPQAELPERLGKLLIGVNEELLYKYSGNDATKHVDPAR